VKGAPKQTGERDGYPAARLPKALVRKALLDWFAVSARDLPWRRERSLYRTVVSEFMLQQTQVKTVLPYFERWMARFPSFEQLAKASEEEVLELWQGLGYYRRARFLHRLAAAVVRRETPPESAREWTQMPGVGAYTAAAIASLAHNEPVAVVDGNVARVMARLIGDRRSYRQAAQVIAEMRPWAEALLDRRVPGTFNEAMMELGAMICTPRKPACLQCPLRTWCAAAGALDVERIPAVSRPTTIERQRDLAWVIRGPQLLLHRKPDDAKRLAGLWELPVLDLLPSSVEGPGELFFEGTRGIGNERIRERVFVVTFVGKSGLPGEASDWAWVNREEIARYPLSGPHRKWIERYWKESSLPAAPSR